MQFLNGLSLVYIPQCQNWTAKTPFENVAKRSWQYAIGNKR